MPTDDAQLDSDEAYIANDTGTRTKTHRKRRKVNSESAAPLNSSPSPIFDELGNGNPTITSFQDIIDGMLADCLQTRMNLQLNVIGSDINDQPLRAPTRAEVSSLINDIGNRHEPASVSTAMAQRKLKLSRERRKAKVPKALIEGSNTITPLYQSTGSISHQAVDALYSIQSTPFASSFLSRLQGTRGVEQPSAIAVDWETITPWMSLMNDLRDHYVLSHPERERPTEFTAPIIYTPLERLHLREVHDLLERTFWKGINVSDSLDHSPERCTIVALYKRLVVGVAILSSPRETYITYLAVRAGWDNARIARSLLYHLIMLNPKKDIMLHVSVNNSAMLLYNRFGFKAEEFVVGFYKDYLAPNSRASKNAFRLRLRQQ